MVDYYIHLWPLENSSPEHTKVNATKYTSDLHLSTLLEKLPSKMDQHAKPNITVNKQEVHNKNCRAQVSSIQQRRVAERHKKSWTELWSKSRLNTKLELMLVIWSKTRLKSLV